MIIFLNDMVEGKFEYDLVVVGSGIAGTAFLDGLLKRNEGRRVALLESGLFYYSQNHQMQNVDAEPSGSYFPLAATRIRQLGGTSNHWTGLTARSARQILPIDEFQSRRNTFYSMADELLEVDTSGDASDLEKSPDGIASFKWILSPPTRLLNTKMNLYSSKSLSVYLDATVTDINMDVDNVKYLTVASLNGKQAHFYAQKFVFAMGGVDTARLLLHCGFDKRDISGIGKGFCEHPHFEIGVLHSDKSERGRVASRFTSNERGITGISYKSAAGSAGVTLREHPFSEEVLDVATAFRRLNLEAEAGGLNKKSIYDVGRILTSPFLTYRYFSQRSKGTGLYDVRVMASQKYRHENSIQLGNKLDAYGIPLPKLTWSMGNEDMEFFFNMAMELGAFFRQEKLGVLQVAPAILERKFAQPSDVLGGFHHMCTLRMGDDESSPVSKDLKLKTTNNLYVLGSSLFTQLDFVNPSLTVAALSYYAAEII